MLRTQCFVNLGDGDPIGVERHQTVVDFLKVLSLSLIIKLEMVLLRKFFKCGQGLGLGEPDEEAEASNISRKGEVDPGILDLTREARRVIEVGFRFRAT